MGRSGKDEADGLGNVIPIEGDQPFIYLPGSPFLAFESTFGEFGFDHSGMYRRAPNAKRKQINTHGFVECIHSVCRGTIHVAFWVLCFACNRSSVDDMRILASF